MKGLLPLNLTYWVEFSRFTFDTIRKPAFFKAGLVENSFCRPRAPRSLNGFQTAQLARQKRY
jgi:hypothetical protein